MTIGEKLKMMRCQNLWTQVGFGKKLGWPDSRVGCYERDEHKPSKASLKKIAKVYGISYEELVKGTELEVAKREILASATGYEVECCCHCGCEIEVRWNIINDGFQAICPVCGNRLMLCDACHHRYGDYVDDCDYDSKTDRCRYSRDPEWWRNKDATAKKRYF